MTARFIIFYLIMHVAAHLPAQKLPEYSIRVKAEHGFTMLHTPKLDYIVKEHIQGIEVEWLKQTYGNKEWQQRYNYPSWGVLYAYRNLGNKNLLGSGHSLIFNTRFPLVRKNNWNAGFAVGTGPAIIEKKFHHTDNYKNIAIGSHFNIAIRFEADVSYKINEHQLGAALAFNHYSNAAFTSPNLGLNIPTIGLTYSYYFGAKKEFVKDSVAAYKSSFEKTILLIAGIKEIAPPGGNKFLVTAGAFSFSRKIGYKSRPGAGIDLIYDPSAGERIERDSSTAVITDNIRTGLFLSHEWMISRFSLITQAGVYLYAKKNTEGNLYQRIGFRYSWNEKYFANVSLKTHFANADYAEWGVGYRF